MKNSKVLILIGISMILSSACLCGGLNSIVDRLPFNLDDQFPEQIATAIVEQLPDLATQASDQLQQLTPETEQSNQVDPNSQMGNEQSGLDNLDSYHSQLVIELTGEDENGNSVNETNRFIQEIIRDQQASKIIVINESNGEISQRLEIYSIDGNTYMLNSNNSKTELSCILMSDPNNIGEEMSTLDLIPPNEMITDIEGGDLVAKGEKINGIMTNHFSLENGAVFGTLVTSGNSDLWKAQDGDYLVRAIGKGEGEMVSMIIGGQITGEIVWQYDLLDVNKLEEIVVPQICLETSEEIQKDIPILDNAEELSIFGQIISYKTSDNTENVVNFYKSEMVNYGYSLTSDLSFAGTYNLIFSKDGSNVNIAITTEDTGGSSVIIIKE